jgi:hypothetical protein
MSAPGEVELPVNHHVKLPPDLAATLRRLVYETGRSKQDLLLAAVQQVYGETNGGAES